MADRNYFLELYVLPDRDTPLDAFTSGTPFGGFSVGDYIHASFLGPEESQGGPGDPPLRIGRIEHVVFKVKDGSMAHKIMLFAEPGK